MRLICPNCGAQYEVPDEVIPEAGRDVQCSNCGTTWFQTRGGPAEPGPPESSTEDTPAPASQPAPEPQSLPEDATPPPQQPPRPSGNAESDSFDPPDRADGAADTDSQGSRDGMTAASVAEDETVPRRRLDPAVADLLREEAERETRARAQERQPLESQPDLGLDDQSPSTPPPDRGTAAPEAAPGRARTAARSRGALLPDIDEINSNLRPTEPEPEPEPEPVYETPQRSSGFSRGFALALLAGVLLIALYAQADRLAEALPVLSPLLEAYVAALDGFRGWAHQTITALLVWIEGLGDG